MKNLKIIISLIVVGFVSIAKAEFKLPKHEKFQLKNGLTIYLMQQKEVPLIDIQLVVKAGAIHDENAYGLANMTSNAMTFGSGNLSKNEVEDLLAFHGARLSTSTDTEVSLLRISIASQDQNKLLPVFRDIALKPKFLAEEFDKYKIRFTNQLSQDRESPRNIISSLFEKMYYGKHPYGNPVKGDSSTVGKIRLEQVKNFYKSYYKPANSALVVVGDFKLQPMKKRLAELFGGWKGKQTKALPLPKVEALSESRVWLVDKGDARETTFMIGGKGIPTGHPDYVAARVVNTILGARFTSWLNDELRVNTGLTYGARSRFNENATGGSFVISTFTKSSTTFEAVDLALKTYQRLWSRGIDKETLESAKAYVKGQFPPNYETSGQLANLLGRMWAFNIPDAFINDFEKQVDSLDVGKANDLALRLFPKENLQFLLIGNAKEIGNKASQYGKVKQMDIKTFEY